MRDFISNAIKIGFVSSKDSYYNNLRSVAVKEYPFTRIGFKKFPIESSPDTILYNVLVSELDILIIQVNELDNKTIKMLKLLNRIKLDRKITITLILEGKRTNTNGQISDYGADLIYYQNKDYESVLFNSIFSSKPNFIDRSRFAIGILKEPYYKTSLIPFKIKHFGPTSMVASSDITLSKGSYSCSGALFDKKIIGQNKGYITPILGGEVCYFKNPYCIKITHADPIKKVKGENLKSILLKKRYREEEELARIEKCKEIIKELPINSDEKRASGLVISKDFSFLSNNSVIIEDYDVSFSNSLEITEEYLFKNRPEIIFIQLSSEDIASGKRIDEDDVNTLFKQVCKIKDYKPIIMIFGAVNGSEFFRLNLNYRRVFSATRKLSKMDIRIFINSYTKAMNKDKPSTNEKNPDVLASPLGNENWADIFIEDDIRVHGMSENYIIFSSDNRYPIDSNFEMELHGLRVSVKVIDYSLNRSSKMKIGVFHGVGENGKDHLRRLSQELYFISKNIKKSS